MAEFTRFDFHAKRFYFSEHVRVMTAEEIGQYLLLLVEAWMGGKDASLPDNPELLARYARVPTVSENVLKMFPVVETESGARRRNPTLFDEWSRAVDRSEQGRRDVAKRTDRAGATTETPNSNKLPTSDLQATYRKPLTALLTHTTPIQSKPGSDQSGPIHNQPSPTNGAEEVETSGAAAPCPASSEPNFKLFRSVFNQTLGKHGNLGNRKDLVAKYEDACKQHGAQAVLDAIKYWANDSTLSWIARENVTYPFGAFLKRLPDVALEMKADVSRDEAMIDATTLVEALPSANIEPAAVESEIARITAEETRKRHARAEKFKQPADTEQSSDVLDYL